MKRIRAGSVVGGSLIGLLLIATWAGGRQSQAELNQTAYKEFQQADRELNTAYTKLMRGLDDTRKAKLKVAQRAWIKFRDAESAFYASEMEGGSAYPMLYSGTQARLTRQRTQVFQKMIKELGIQ